ncbi:putative aquaporin TIP5-1 [Camellia lanceoleosa]|uniref:Aquaporin TIP5-1 n=1 Tax=Camellia lanceoleosa TaxID=1840588 RepID=A0ACC0H1A1_9ERIC|nr:putative aquaporin TIP5-1 [Camellia lanceoleosa]
MKRDETSDSLRQQTARAEDTNEEDKEPSRCLLIKGKGRPYGPQICCELQFCGRLEIRMAHAMASLTSRLEHAVKSNVLRSYLAEFISAFLFVFAAVGSAMSYRKMMPNATTAPFVLVAIVDVNAFALSVAVYTAANISGSYLVGSVMACLFSKVTTISQYVLVQGIPQEITRFKASILEGVMTFGLVYTVYATGDSRCGLLGAIGPLAIGFIVGANVLASGPFMGRSMNLAYLFGSALVGGSFKNHVVYWVGPLIGATLAGILYDNVVFLVQVPGITDGVGV